VSAKYIISINRQKLNPYAADKNRKSIPSGMHSKEHLKLFCELLTVNCKLSDTAYTL